jgi:hypothetical protein
MRQRESLRLLSATPEAWGKNSPVTERTLNGGYVPRRRVIAESWHEELHPVGQETHILAGLADVVSAVEARFFRVETTSGRRVMAR